MLESPIVRTLVSALLVGSPALAQEPLFTMTQVSDSQPRTADEYERFERVLTTIAEGGQPGAFLPRAVDVVLFAGDITYGNTRAEWDAATLRLDTWLTANGIPFLAVPGNHDVDNEDVALYEEYIAQAEPWDRSSEALVGHNGLTFTSNWKGMRFIGFNNSNPGWNTMTSADLAAVEARLAAAVAAEENVFFLAHHPHDDKDRMPLRDLLPEPLLVGYLRGHTDDLQVVQGLAEIANPNVWDVSTNAIYKDACLVYFEVFQSELHAYPITLDESPSSIGVPTVMPLVHPLVRASEPDFGVPGPFHAGAPSPVTARTPERSAWFADGAWHAVLWSESAAAHRVHRLDPSDAWLDVGPTVSAAPERAFDVLVEGDALLVASNVPTVPATGGGGSPGLLHRFTFDAGAGAYVADAGYPVAVNDARSASLVLARDGAGVLWAAWAQGGTAWASRTGAGDADWGAPLALAGGLGDADTVALAHLGDRLAALWTDASGAATCALHEDGAADGAWTLETAAAAGAVAGGALDLVAGGGRLFAAVGRAGGGLDLLARAVGGGWSTHALGEDADELSQPLLLHDDPMGLLRLVATAPTLADRSTAGGGAVFTKVAPLATLAFPPGRGTPLIQDGLHPSAGHATSARAPLDPAAGLVVLASVAEEARVWHAFDALVALPPAPVADFTAGPLAGPAPLVVDFEDLSSGAPTHWSWDFGDGGTSLERDPRHVFAEPGDYTVTLRAANGFGEDVLARAAYVGVSPAPSTITYTAVADARVSEGRPSSNYGGDSVLRVRDDAGGSYHTYLRFDLSSLPAAATSVRLRIHCTDGSPAGGAVYAVADDLWSEGGITWANRPAPAASPLADLGGVTDGFWAEVELGPGAVEAGLVSLVLADGSSNSAYYASRETATPPELVVTLLGGGTPPVAAFTGTPLQGPAPLVVDFTDQSSNVPSAWSWDFGDGGAASERHPTHVYTQPGTYTVVLDASNSAGLDSLTRLDYVVVEEPPPPPPVQTFPPLGDARVQESSVDRNYGSDSRLRVRSRSGGSAESFLAFDVAALSGPVVSATLRLFCDDGSPDGGDLYLVLSAWDEDTLTWSNRPALPPSPLRALGRVDDGEWYELDVGAAVTGTGTVAFALAGGTSNSAYYSSREGADPPELVVETGEPGPPQADFEATPVTGHAPLQVSFTDRSVGAETHAWTFGDGGTSAERHPVHLYADPGVYTVALEVSNALGSDTRTRPDLVTVTVAPPVRTFFPVADARTNERNPTSEAGSSDVLRVRESSGGSYHTYLRFDLAGLADPVVSARLRLFSTDGSPVAGLVYPTSGAWTEADVNWSNMPGPTGPLVTSLGAVGTDEWAEFDVTSAVVGPGELNLLLQSTSSNSCYYSSREGAQPPELVVETATP